MTNETVSAILDAVLDPLTTVEKQVTTALVLARRNKLPGPLIDTIHHSLEQLLEAWAALNEIATTLDPDRAIPEL